MDKKMLERIKSLCLFDDIFMNAFLEIYPSRKRWYKGKRRRSERNERFNGTI